MQSTTSLPEPSIVEPPREAGEPGTIAAPGADDSPRRAITRLWPVIAVVAYAVGLYVFIQLALPRILSAISEKPGLDWVWYVVTPALWASLAVAGFFAWKRGVADKPPLNRSLILLSALAGVFQIALFLLAGLLIKFGTSPYSHSFAFLVANTAYFAATITAIELVRASLVRVLGQRHPNLALVVATLLFALLSTSLARLSTAENPKLLFETAGEIYLPALAESMFASFLALAGGPLPAIAYRMIVHAFEYLSPILPNLEWIVTAFVGTIGPVLGLWIVHDQVVGSAETSQEASIEVEKKEKKGSATGWVLVLVVAVALLWFNTGLFGIQPTLVSGPSMNPTLWAGDVVVVRDVPPEKIEVGDIVRFREDDIYIIHRVTEIRFEDNEYIFITQGDNNNVTDAPVSAEQLEGKVILVIPKIGWVSIIARRLIGRLL
jgi:signal peptidase